MTESLKRLHLFVIYGRSSYMPYQLLTNTFHAPHTPPLTSTCYLPNITHSTLFTLTPPIPYWARICSKLIIYALGWLLCGFWFHCLSTIFQTDVLDPVQPQATPLHDWTSAHSQNLSAANRNETGGSHYTRNTLPVEWRKLVPMSGSFHHISIPAPCHHLILL